MSQPYIKSSFSLSNIQKASIKNAFQKKQPVMIRLSKVQISGGPDSLGITKTQYNRIQKAVANNKGVQLSISKAQLQKEGGNPFIIAARAALPLLARAGTWAVKNILPSVISTATEAISGLTNRGNQGRGLVLPGSRKAKGLKLPGFRVGGNKKRKKRIRK